MKLLKVKKKLRPKKINDRICLSYNPFLKNYVLNQKQFKYFHLYESIYIYKNNKFNIFEFNQIETIFHPLKYKIPSFNKKISTSKLFLRSNSLFLNFKLNFFLIKNFNRLFLSQSVFKRNNSFLFGRILKQTKKYTKILVSVFGVLFIIRTRNLHRIIDKLMRNKFVLFHFKKKKKQKKVKINRYFKLEQGRKMLKKYILKQLGFTLVSLKPKPVFSRIEYLKLMKKKNRKIKLRLYIQKKKLRSLVKKRRFLDSKKRIKNLISTRKHKSKKKKKKK